MSVRLPEPLLALALLVLACDEHEPTPPPVRVAPAIDSPCTEEGQLVCDTSRDALRCEDGRWRPHYCTVACDELGPTQCSLGCLIGPEGDSCLCADLGPNCA